MEYIYIYLFFKRLLLQLGVKDETLLLLNAKIFSI